VADIVLDDITIHVEDVGEGPPVVLLHGFPDSHVLWAEKVRALTAAGYRTIAPDLRGYGASSRPEGVERYGLLDIVGDVLGVLDALSVPKAHVVGHDWGAAVAWLMGSFVPDRVDHLVTLSVGHPAAFRTAGFAQREKSWYMLFFQFTGIAEQWLAADDFANFRAWSRHPRADDVAAELARPGALTAALNWYRANLHPQSWVDPPLAFPPVTVPTMGVWSTGDVALTEISMTGSAAHVTGPWRYERIDDAGHWMTIDAPDAVSRLLLDFLPQP
jgi:pimeloyl-ACP methyl ester carboxylesterase